MVLKSGYAGMRLTASHMAVSVADAVEHRVLTQQFARFTYFPRKPDSNRDTPHWTEADKRAAVSRSASAPAVTIACPSKRHTLDGPACQPSSEVPARNLHVISII